MDDDGGQWTCPDPQCGAGVKLYKDKTVWRFGLHTAANFGSRACRFSYTVAQVVVQ